MCTFKSNTVYVTEYQKGCWFAAGVPSMPMPVYQYEVLVLPTTTPQIPNVDLNHNVLVLFYSYSSVMWVTCVFVHTVVAECKRRLTAAGFSELNMKESWKVQPSGKVNMTQVITLNSHLLFVFSVFCHQQLLHHHCLCCGWLLQARKWIFHRRSSHRQPLFQGTIHLHVCALLLM